MLGTQAIGPDCVPVGGPLRGKDEQGNFKTKAEQTYKPLLCKRFAVCMAESLARSACAPTGAAVEGGGHDT